MYSETDIHIPTTERGNEVEIGREREDVCDGEFKREGEEGGRNSCEKELRKR